MGIKVMLVDDSAVMRKMVRRAIEETKLKMDELVEAANGVEALEKLQDHEDIGIIFSDWNMPEMDGLTFVKNLRSNYLFKDVPVIMVTTEASLEKIKQARDAGANAYVTKPFTADKIKEKIIQVMRKG